jgi:DNA-binding response OmpR family regulator
VGEERPHRLENSINQNNLLARHGWPGVSGALILLILAIGRVSEPLLDGGRGRSVSESFPSILCVDDDQEVLELLKEHFTLQGFIVLTATNGVEACLQIKRWAPRAVILDLLIPRLGGIGTLRRIHAIDPSIPVVLVGDPSEALQLAAEAGLGVAGTFAKPLDLDKISSVLAAADVTPPAELAAPFGDLGRASVSAQPRVLLVDDETQFREMLAEYLSGRDFEVFEVGSGEEALDKLAMVDPQLVLLDVMMDGIGGLETLRQIKALRPETCVVMVTAIEDLDTARTALNAGAADYVTKPFTFQFLDSVLDIHLPLENARRDAVPQSSSVA